MKVLNFDGTIYSARAGTAALPGISFANDTNTGIYSPGADQVAISTGGTQRVTFDNFGNLLVGLTSAAGIGGTPADLNSVEIGRGYINISRDDTAAADHILFGKNGSIASSIGTSTTNSLIFKTGTTERLRITSTGTLMHLGAGNSTTPAVQFNGSAPVNSLVMDSSGRVGLGTSTPSYLFDCTQTARVGASGGNWDLIVGNRSANWSTGVSFQGSNTNRNWEISQNRLASNALTFAPSTAGGGNTFSTPLVTFTPTAVGIGTTSPSELLHVAGGNIRLTGSAAVAQTAFREINFTNAETTSSPGVKIVATTGGNTSDHELAFYTTTDNAANTTEKVRISHNGNVGIGTASPASLLHVDGTGATVEARIRNNTSTATQKAALYLTTSTVSTFNSAGIEAIRNGGSTDELAFIQGNTEKARIDGSGRLLVGTSTARTNFGTIQIEGTSYNSIGCINNTNDTGSSALIFGKSRGTATGSNTIVQSGDVLGSVIFQGADGTDMATRAAAIFGIVDGTPGVDDMPGRLVFFTTADGASSPTERMRIDNAGKITCSFATAKLFINSGTTPSVAGDGRAGIHFALNGVLPTNGSGSVSDNTIDLGSSSYRYATVYAGTGTINTSDEAVKQDIQNLDSAEFLVASSIKSLIKKYRFKDAVAEKGDAARIHVGVIAQDVEQAFVDAGLDPRRYGLFCEDEIEGGGKRLAIRYDELLAFVVAAL